MTLDVLGALVRWAMAIVGGYLVGQHVLTTDQADRLTSDVVRHVLLAVPIVVPIVWSIVQKYRARAAARWAEILKS